VEEHHHRQKGARRIEGELGPLLFITPPDRGWDEAAFYQALSKAREPSVTTALTVVEMGEG
jgi:hypothetical protein